jgi:hypothetical protein
LSGAQHAVQDAFMPVPDIPGIGVTVPLFNFLRCAAI